MLTASGPAAMRDVSARVLEKVSVGKTMADGLEGQPVPPMFHALVEVGEETGRLPEILADLEEYLRQEETLKRQFRQQTLLPKIQMFAAIAIVAGLIWILGMIAGSRGGTPIAIFGLTGTKGAIIFLTATLGPIAAIWLWWKSVSHRAGAAVGVQLFMLKTPLIGPCWRAILLNRLTLGLQHTLNSSLPVAKALRLSFAATGSPAFEQGLDEAQAAVKRGGSLRDALGLCRHVPPELLDMIAMAEEGGTIPETMKQQSQYYRETARDRLTLLTMFASGLIWLMVAVFIIVCIFRIAMIYINALGV